MKYVSLYCGMNARNISSPDRTASQTNCTHPRYSQGLADISSAMHTEPPRRSSVQNNLPRTHGVITAFKMVPPVGNRRQQRSNSWRSTGTWNSAQTRFIRQESRSYHNTECLIGSTKFAPKFLFLITKYYYSSRSILEAQRIVYLKKGV
jgi:hypothetical protein